MPVYNVQSYVKLAVDSVLHQDYRNLELILLDDGSQDGTLDILQHYATDPRVKLISRENRGLVASLNEAISVASGELIARMDGDDMCYQGRIREQVGCFIDNQNLDVCATHIDYMLSDHKVLAVAPNRLASEEIRIANIFDVYVTHPTLMFSRRLFDRGIAYKNEHPYCEDFDLIRTVSRFWPVRFIARPFLAFRINHAGSIRSTYAKIQAHGYHKIVEENLKLYAIIDNDCSLLSECTRQGYDIRNVDADHFQATLSRIFAGAKLFSDKAGIYKLFYTIFVNHLFKALVMNNDVCSAAERYSKAGLLNYLHRREKLLIYLRKIFPSDQALHIRDRSVQISQVLRARDVRMADQPRQISLVVPSQEKLMKHRGWILPE
jgi:glycosyltransferase involved in cell wall biosynthesis